MERTGLKPTKMQALCFIFGSNLAGKHGKGAALHARKVWGAEYGVGEGPTGYAYALPTKDKRLKTRSLPEIYDSLKLLHYWVCKRPYTLFLMTPVGTGLAGYSKEEIKFLLEQFHWPNNFVLTSSWLETH